MPLFPRYDGPPLMEDICSVENMTRAWRRVRSNIQLARRRHSAGPDDVSIRDFEARWTEQMSQLAEELREGTYRPLPPRHITIPKRNGGERPIAVLAVRDRIAQRAVHQVLEPLFDPLFLDCSYGCRSLVGVPDAVARVQRYADQGLTWVADADIAGYFDAIDQRILLGLVRQRVDELPVLRLISQWLAAGALRPGSDPLDAVAIDTPLRRGEQAIRTLIAWGGEVGAPAQPAAPDPYAAAAWETPGAGFPEYGAWQPRTPGLESHLWTAAMVAKPVVAGVRQALPYIQKIGGKRLAIAGAVAAGAVAATEIALRARQAPRGTPQGGALSPLLANIYLHPFDLALSSQGLRLVRFMDDFVIMSASRAEAEQSMELARRQLASLRLTLSAEKSRVIAYADGVEFLGCVLGPRHSGPRPEDGLSSFEEAEDALRRMASGVRTKVGGLRDRKRDRR